MTSALTFGRYGGFYFRHGYAIRLCLGWVALTWFPVDLDDILDRLIRRGASPPREGEAL